MINKNVGYIYILFDVKNKISRVGKTKNKDLKRPLSQISYYPYPLLMFHFLIENYNDIETDLHRKFKNIKTNGDWYNINVMKIIEHVNENYNWIEFDAPSPKQIMSELQNIYNNGK